MRALYISHNGMLEGLGRSQVLGYVRGLARTGIEFDLVSYELSANTDEVVALRRELAGNNIRWHPLARTGGGSLGKKVVESMRGALEAFSSAVARRPAIVHARSYLPTSVADLVATALPRTKLLFDCRGMLGDEYVDAGYWTPERLEYRLLKRYEKRAFRRAEGVVVLTDALRHWLDERGAFGSRTLVQTIPCCVDLYAFEHDGDARSSGRRALGWTEDDLVLVYAGSLGSWYREADIARFVEVVRQRTSRTVRFLLLTTAPHRDLTAKLERAGLDAASIVARAVRPEAMAKHLSIGDIGVSFIKSCFSKMGSSPTKVAEYLACGLPVVANGDIGDQRELATEREACIILDSFDEAALGKAADDAIALAGRPLQDRVANCRGVAERRFGLEHVGVRRYGQLYAALASGA